MMPSDFIRLDGTKEEFDLDAVHELVRGYSGQREGWTSLVVYEPRLKVFIELRSSPQDFRGNSADEAQEVPIEYLKSAYSIEEISLARFLRDPESWKLIDLRKRGS